MATRTFTPQLGRLADRLNRYIDKHGDKLQANLPSNGVSWTDVTTLQTDAKQVKKLLVSYDP